MNYRVRTIQSNVKSSHISNLKFIILTLYVFTFIQLFSTNIYAENWVVKGSSETRLKELINEIDENVSVAEKDVLEAFRKAEYKVYVDTDSIKDTTKDRRETRLKAVFVTEHLLKDSNKKFKFVIANMTFNCIEKVIWFVDGVIYDKNGVRLEYAKTIFLPVFLDKLSKTSLERNMWEFVCNY